MQIQLFGRVILGAYIRAGTGLRIGGSPAALAIGAVDLPVIRNQLTQEPYIPGSSLKGKMRSQMEKALGAEQNYRIKGDSVKIHAPEKEMDYEGSIVAKVFGTVAYKKVSAPTRIIVRDVPLMVKSLERAKTDLPFTEVKWEAAIDRVTSMAAPRQIERVPAGAVFGPMQIVFSIYRAGDHELFLRVLESLRLIEDDYLGGHGSRGSGRVTFVNLKITSRSTADYAASQTYPTPKETGFASLDSLIASQDLLQWLKASIPVPASAGAQ